jgi:hypothetical protein
MANFTIRGSRPGQIVKSRTKTRASHGSGDGLRLRNKIGIQLGTGDTQPMLHGEFVGGYLFLLRSK